MKIPNPDNLSEEWVERAICLMEFGFPYEQAYHLSWLYSVRNNVEGYKELVCPLVKIASLTKL